MAYRQTRTAVRTSKPAQHQQQQQYQQQQRFSQSFVSGGTVRPNNPPVARYSTPSTPASNTHPMPPAPVISAQPTPAAPVNKTQPTPAAPKPETKDRDGDVVMDTTTTPQVDMDPEELKAERRRLYDGLKKVNGVRKKPTKQMVQRRLRKHLAPKNATMALHDVCPDASFNISAMPDVTPPFFMAEVEVGGKQYQGTGGSKALARAAAAERALRSFVQPPTKTKDSEGKETVEDTTPWSSLAGFALHKLFCDWGEGRFGVPLSVEGFELPPTKGADSSQKDTPMTDAAKSATVQEKKKPKPAKQLPTDALSRHPVMLLHEMRPDVVFDIKEQVAGQRGQTPSVTIAATVDGQTFQGKARTKKVAKREAAKAAMLALFGVQYPAETE